MSHQGHEILKCNRCERAIMQCRCIDKNKPIRWTTCESCHQKAITDGFSKPSEETQQ